MAVSLITTQCCKRSRARARERKLERQLEREKKRTLSNKVSKSNLIKIIGMGRANGIKSKTAFVEFFMENLKIYK